MSKLGSKLYSDARGLQLDAEVLRHCWTAGIRSPQAIAAKQAESRAAHAPLWLENPRMSVDEDREIRAARALKPLPPAEHAAATVRRVANLRTPIYGTADKVALVLAAEQVANRAKPVLNGILNGPAGSSVPAVRLRFAARAAEMDRPSTTSKSFYK